MTTKLIIFDFDGVIITGSNKGYFTCYHKALEAVGVKFSPVEERKRILAQWGKGYVSQIKFLLKEHPELIEKAIKAYKKCYYSPIFNEKIKLVKGTKDAFKKLSNKYILAIASGMMKKTMDHLIKRFDINFFRKIITIDDVINERDKKPAPYMLKEIMKFFHVSEKETIYVGDAKNDVIMAKKAKVTPVVVLTGHLRKKEAEDLGVKYIIKDITYLKDLVARLNNYV